MEKIVNRMEQHGFQTKTPHNPFWDRKGKLFERQTEKEYRFFEQYICIRHPQRLKGASGIPLDRGRCPYGRGGLGMTDLMQNG